MVMGITWTHLESDWNPSFRSFRVPQLHKPVTGQELFFAVSYSKPALVLLHIKSCILLDYVNKQRLIRKVEVKPGNL